MFRPYSGVQCVTDAVAACVAQVPHEPRSDGHQSGFHTPHSSRTCCCLHAGQFDGAEHPSRIQIHDVNGRVLCKEQDQFLTGINGHHVPHPQRSAVACSVRMLQRELLDDVQYGRLRPCCMRTQFLRHPLCPLGGGEARGGKLLTKGVQIRLFFHDDLNAHHFAIAHQRQFLLQRGTEALLPEGGNGQADKRSEQE